MERLMANIVHYPSLKTVLAIEDVVKNADTSLSRNQILARLPTKVMRSTLNLALVYMEKRGLILETETGFIWTFNSNSNIEKVEKSSLMTYSNRRLNKNIQKDPENNVAEIKARILPILRHNGVKRAAIFGSVARGEATKKSDVDFLIEFKKERPTLFDVGGLKGELEKKLKRSVDLVLFRSIDSRLKERILRERVDII
jgi:hypothetical protein